jgi:NAD(P)-dependent dehydrogenase (short-subunit alcohol dehydrogenase family)
MSQPLKGKVALVTGGGKNLGGLISLQMAEAGAAVAVHYNSAGSQKGAEDTVKEIEKKGGKAAPFQADMTKPAGKPDFEVSYDANSSVEVKKLFDEVVAKFGKVNIAVNNVGKVLKKPIVETTEEEYDEM